MSEIFYKISWESDQILKRQQTNLDFVSGYAMTNKYEDFAESFAYYVLHNTDFVKRAKKSESLQKKYNFFRQYIFPSGIFQTDVYSSVSSPKEYYWDVTKIDYDLQEFLAYLSLWTDGK